MWRARSSNQRMSVRSQHGEAPDVFRPGFGRPSCVPDQCTAPVGGPASGDTSSRTPPRHRTYLVTDPVTEDTTASSPPGQKPPNLSVYPRFLLTDRVYPG